ncbi:MAG: efflux RND transporter periplasmic adaptor subunit [Alphaproteobacteria bacterium]|nr:efflux RND transporter periplasmic adaptor subunit [Alphaproteobacteria bacterium]
MAQSKSELLGQLSLDTDARENSPRQGGGFWRSFVLAVLFAAAGAAGAFAYVQFFSASPAVIDAGAPPRAENAGGAAVEPAPLKPAAKGGAILSASGYVVARRQATVSAEITGRVAEVLIEEGMRVEEGQVVARLDATLARIDLAVGEANARAAAATALEAERTLRRRQNLSIGSSVSEAQLTEAEAGAAAARAQSDLAVEEVARLRALLDKYEIRAPFTGIVTTKDAQPGEIISPAAAGGGFTRTGICTVVDMESLEIEVDVNEAYISRVVPGQRARATLDAYPDWPIKASVIAIIPTADRARATVKVRIKLEERDARVLPEMAAKVQFLDSSDVTQ